MKTVTENTFPNINAAYLASRQNGAARATLYVSRAGVDSVYHGFSADPETDVVTLCGDNQTFLFVEPTDIITYDDGTP